MVQDLTPLCIENFDFLQNQMELTPFLQLEMNLEKADDVFKVDLKQKESTIKTDFYLFL